MSGLLFLHALSIIGTNVCIFPQSHGLLDRHIFFGSIVFFSISPDLNLFLVCVSLFIIIVDVLIQFYILSGS